MLGGHLSLGVPVRTKRTVTDEHGRWALETSHTFAFDDEVTVNHHLDVAPIRGVVVDEDGHPVATNAEVGLDEAVWALAQLLARSPIGDGTRVVTGADGRFALPTAPDRTVTLRVAHDDFWCEPLEVGDERGDLRITVRRGGRVVVDLEDTSGRPFAPGTLMTVRASLENTATGARERLIGERYAVRLVTRAIPPAE